MTLRNAFADLALESTSNNILNTVATEVTANNTYIQLITTQQELLENIVDQLKIINLHLGYLSGNEFTIEDIE